MTHRSFIEIHITTSSRTEADTIARALVDERLAACVNILPHIQSIYRWEGQVEKAEEVLLIAKTRADLFLSVCEGVKALHSHLCPCIIAVPIVAGHPAYLDWLESETI